MEKMLKLIIILTIALSISASAFAAKKSSTIEYLDALHNQGKERVIVTFEDKIDINSVTKYQVRVIRDLKIINAVVCEIDKDKIELLKQEKGLSNLFSVNSFFF